MNPRGPPPFLVSEDCSKITWKGKMLDLPAFGVAVRSLLAATRNDLDDLLSRAKGNLSPCLRNFSDNWSQTDSGYSWKTAFLEPIPIAVNSEPSAAPQDALIEALRLVLKFDQTTLVDGAVVADYLRRCTAICKNLALLVFLTMGKPPPVFSMVEFLYSNSPTKNRNMFWRENNFWFISGQSANAGVLSAYKISTSVTNLLLKYFVYVRPAEIWLYSLSRRRSAQDKEEARHLCSTMTWIDASKMQKLQPEDLSQLVKDFFLQSENLHQQSIGPVAYAQLYTEVLRNYCEQQTTTIDTNAEQAGHSLGMARTNYAVESDQLPGMPSDRLLEFGRKSEIWWQDLLQLDVNEPKPPVPLHLRPCNEAQKKMAMNRMLDEVKNRLLTR